MFRRDADNDDDDDDDDDEIVCTGDILENYCYSDDLVNVARVLFAVAVMLTYPVECFVTREVYIVYVQRAADTALCRDDYSLPRLPSILITCQLIHAN